nr:uncharacterized protein rsn1 [Quercus suber]POF24055.1 uncharacterized protein rsn1 [Quercus suber]
MATSTSASASASPTCTGNLFHLAVECNNSAALNSSGQNINSLLAAIAGSFASFGTQFVIFALLRLRLSRIYRPRSYLVPERERVPPPPSGLVAWVVPLFTTPNLAFIQKCGLDAYFFLRYLRMLLKFFFPVALVVLPILLPINRFSHGDQHGLDQVSISNIGPAYRGSRLWAHLILAICTIVWFCYIVYKELRGYIRVRQAYLTSPQHRIRASATTVLVTGIPAKWLTLEALSGLYDVFPGGIKNIWINRNYDELSDKVHLRDNVARSLEDAELNLIKTCLKKHEKAEKDRVKKEGKRKKTKDELKQERDKEDAAAERLAQGDGVSAGDQHQVAHDMIDVLHEAEESEVREQHKPNNPLGYVNQGLGLVGDRLGAFGKGVGFLGQKVVGGVDESFVRAGHGLTKAGEELNHATVAANTGMGFSTDDALFRPATNSGSDRIPSPTSKSPISPVTASSPVFGASTQPHPFSLTAHIPGDGTDDTPTSEKFAYSPNVQLTRPSVESKPRSQLQIEEPESHRAKPRRWEVWRNHDNSLALPSPQPHTADEDEFPLNASTVRARPVAEPEKEKSTKSSWKHKLAFWKHSDEKAEVYPSAVDSRWDKDQDEEPRWRHYIEPKERETMRLPIIFPSWFPGLPLIGEKVDRIYHLRRELARLNLEIETDQDNIEKFPRMNSAFIQFNHQVAAHMACQSLSHHIPQQMAPRLVEISPDDVLWDNMSIKWWERYVRGGIVLAVIVGLIILYAVPVAFTSLIANVDQLAATFKWLHWLQNFPRIAKSIIEGIIPPILLSVILALVPIIIRFLVKNQGVPTGNSRETGVQLWYFGFLFFQVFFVVTLSSGLTQFFSELARNPGSVVSQLAQNLPKASNYFFNYLMVQSLSNGASALLQIGALVGWFIFGPIFDSTPRSKWRRQTKLSNIQWGSFFPPFANFAAIGIIYAIIAPLILVFMLIIFGLFWIVYRYNVLYVYQFRIDTGGLLFPTAVNQLFTGIYVLELALVGYFFISTDNGKIVCLPQAIIMIIALVLTIFYHWQLNSTFQPLLRYLPITLEDEAVIRDEEFARAQASKFAPLNEGEGHDEDDSSLQDQLEERERREEAENDMAEESDLRETQEHRRIGHNTAATSLSTPSSKLSRDHKNTRSPATTETWKTDRWRHAAPLAVSRIRHLATAKHERPKNTDVNPQKQTQDLEAQHTVGDILFSGFADELEDLTPEERDLLVRYSFQHSALRAKRPVVWIPRDRLGVSDDEIKRAKRMSTVDVDDEQEKKGGKKTFIWMSNEGTALDAKHRVVFRRSPPDFSNVDLIAL